MNEKTNDDILRKIGGSRDMSKTQGNMLNTSSLNLNLDNVRVLSQSLRAEITNAYKDHGDEMYVDFMRALDNIGAVATAAPILLADFDIAKILQDSNLLLTLSSFDIDAVGEDIRLMWRFCRYAHGKIKAESDTQALSHGLVLLNALRFQRDDSLAITRVTKIFASHAKAWFDELNAGWDEVHGPSASADNVQGDGKKQPTPTGQNVVKAVFNRRQ